MRTPPRWAPRSDLSRDRTADTAKVTFIELFFDLVFVFAVTQLSHSLRQHFSVDGVAQTTLLMMAVWWVWVYTTWFTNHLEPENTPVRLVLLSLMLAGLVMSTSLPHAFEERGLSFAGAYVFMQLTRCFFVLWALKHYNQQNYLNFVRVTSWLALSAVFWIAGALANDHLRLQLWIVALFLEYLSPAIGYWLPVLGRSATSDWDVEGHHFAERCGLFIIIALGESILVTGMTFTGLPFSLETAAAFVVAFVGSVAMWWIYFDIGAHRGRRRITRSHDPGRLARGAYTYMHLPIVAGIVVTAAADGLILEHPTGDTNLETAATLLGGTALYLVGNILFKRSIENTYPVSHLAGLALIAGLAFAMPMLTPLHLGMAVTTVLIVVAIWERVSLGRALGSPRVQA